MNISQILNGPALLPPPGVQLQLDHPPNENKLVHSVTAVCLFFTTIAVFIRLYSRIFVAKQVRIEDALIFAGYGVYIGFIYCIYRVISGTGFFVHQWNVRVRDIAEFSYVIFIGSCIYGVVIASVKVAILLEWMRIFVPSPTRNAFYYSCWALIVFNSLYYLAATITQNVACTPYRYTWDKTIQGGHCANVPAVNVVSAGINLVSDLAIFILPQNVIWRLQMSTRNKIGISLIFAVGIFGCVAAIIRVVVTLNYEHADDVTYTVSPVALWALGEMTSVFLVACIPAFPKAFTSQGILTRVAVRLASWTGLSSRKASATNLAGPWANENGPKHPRYLKMHADDDLLLTTMASTKDNHLESESSHKVQHSLAPEGPHIIRTTDIYQEGELSGDQGEGKAAKELVRQQHPWISEQQS